MPGYRISLWDGAFLAVGGVMARTLHALGPRLMRAPCAPCDPLALNSFDRDAIRWHSRFLDYLSYAIEVAAMAAPFVTSLQDRGLDRRTVADMWVFLEVITLDSMLNIAVKSAAQRPIPRSYTDLYPESAAEPSAYRSFYSGHTAQTAAALAANAVMSAKRDSGRRWPWPAVVLGVAAVSVARVGAGKHFYTDTVTGAAAGALVGALVPLLHPVETETSRG